MQYANNVVFKLKEKRMQMRHKLCQPKSLNNEKINANKEDLPSATTTFEKHGGGRSCSKPTFTVIADASLEILKAVNDMPALTRIDNGKVNDQDMKDVIENTDALLEEKKSKNQLEKCTKGIKTLGQAFVKKTMLKKNMMMLV